MPRVETERKPGWGNGGGWAASDVRHTTTSDGHRDQHRPAQGLLKTGEDVATAIDPNPLRFAYGRKEPVIRGGKP